MKSRLGWLIVSVFVLTTMVLAACVMPAPPPATEGDQGAAAEATVAPAEEAPAEEASSEDATTTEGAELPLVRVGQVPVTIYAPLFIAVEKGYFADEGMNVELLPVDSGNDTVVQTAAGNFDVAGGGVGAAMLNAVARGIEFEIVAPLHTEFPPLTSPFVVSKARFDSGELTTMADLDGKKVATNARGAATEYWLWSALQQGGLDFPDVEVLGVPFRDTVAALESGSLDGSILGEPLTTLAEDQGLVARVSQDFIEGMTPTYIYFNTDWSAANPELAQGFVRAYLRGARDLNGASWSDPENLAIIEKYTKVPADVVARANRSYHDPNGNIPLEDMMTLQDFFRSQGELNYDENIDLAQFVNTSYVEQAVADLGGPVEWER